ncbi:D-amino acid aminotransferase [soil metagenome]
MKFPHISHNDEIVPMTEAHVPVDQTEIAYGFGVYETIKIRNKIIYFLPQHIERLMHSAEKIGLLHRFTPQIVEHAVKELSQKIEEPSCNLKVLLYGTPHREKTELFIIPSAPLYPDRKWYREGVSVFSFEHERWMPQAKTLNMLPSYYMYKKAKEQGGYDALLYNKKGNILEGTRTNVYAIKGKKIVSPQKKDVLEGVTMMTLEKVIEKTDYTLEYRDISMESLLEYTSMFLSSTSTKLLPVKAIDGKEYKTISEELKQLIQIYEEALDNCRGDFNLL